MTRHDRYLHRLLLGIYKGMKREGTDWAMTFSETALFWWFDSGDDLNFGSKSRRARRYRERYYCALE